MRDAAKAQASVSWEKAHVQSQTTTIIIADDHPLFRGALRQAVASTMPQARVVEASGMDDLNVTLTQERDVDLILLDLTMPGVQGFSGLMSLRAQYPELPVVIVSATEEPTVIRRAMDFGASGFIPKSIDIDSIGGAIQAVLAGDTWTPPDVDLSAAEDAETAYELGVSEATVKAHVSAILDKLGVDSRTQAVIAASKIGVTQRPSPAG